MIFKVDNPIKFSNEYFEELFENEWTEKKITESGKIQFTNSYDNNPNNVAN